MRLPAESGNRLKRMANRHGWTPSDTSARRQFLAALVCDSKMALVGAID
jgi:hypothetical protein